MKQKPIRVLFVEDSAFMCLQLRSILKDDDRFEIVGEAHDGEEALRLVRELRPDVMTLDLELPKKDGLEVLKEVMEKTPLPVMIVSVLAKENAEVTLKALELGAVDFITKPTPTQAQTLKKEFPLKLYYASKANLLRLKYFTKIPESSSKSRGRPMKESNLVVIGASIGGPQTLHYLLPQFPADFPAPVIIVQHMPRIYTEKFTSALKQKCRVDVKLAEQGDLLSPGAAYVAQGGYHLVVDRHGRLELNEDEPVNSVRPALDVTLVSAARAFKERVIAVVLTGMGRDGTKGAVEVKHHGGTVVAETEKSCVVYGMSKSVIDAGLCDHELPLEKIGPFLLTRLGCRTA